MMSVTPRTLLVGTLAICATLSGCGQQSNEAQAQTPVEAQSLLRSEFTATVMGKSANEVINAVGRPESNQDHGKIAYWAYDGKTKDPVTGKRDNMTQVEFHDGRVVNVHFY